MRSGLPDGWEAFNGGGNDIDPNIPNGYLLLDHPDDWIVTPAMNLLDYDDVQLTMDLRRQTGSGNHRHLLVEVSNDDGLTWTHDSFITDQAGLNWQTRGPHPFSTDGEKIRLRFRRVDQNYPNPFNTGTIIPFDMPVEGNVEILIYNILGQRVVRIQRGMMPPGRHLQSVEFSAMASGVYLYELRISDTASPYRKTRKMMLIK